MMETTVGHFCSAAKSSTSLTLFESSSVTDFPLFASSLLYLPVGHDESLVVKHHSFTSVSCTTQDQSPGTIAQRAANALVSAHLVWYVQTYAVLVSHGDV
jgi:hypothetical protein